MDKQDLLFASMMEDYMVNLDSNEVRAEVPGDVMAVYYRMKKNEPDVSMGLAHHPKFGWYLMTTGQGPIAHEIYDLLNEFEREDKERDRVIEEISESVGSDLRLLTPFKGHILVGSDLYEIEFNDKEVVLSGKGFCFKCLVSIIPEGEAVKYIERMTSFLKEMKEI